MADDTATEELMEALADVFKRSIDDGPVELYVDGGLMHLKPCDCCGQMQHGPFIDLSGPLDEWLPEGWSLR